METGEETYVKLRLHHTGSKNQERSIRRLQIDQPSISVRDLRILVANMLDDYAQFDLIFCGQLLADKKSLDSYNIRPGSCINVITRDVPDSIPESSVSIEEVVQTLAKLMNPAFRSTVEAILSNTSVIDEAVASSPLLQNDIIAQGILKNVNIISVLANSENIRTVLAKHPALIGATMRISAAVMDRIANKKAVKPAIRGQTYMLDRMNDEDEEMEAQVTSHEMHERLVAAFRATSGGSNPSGGGNLSTGAGASGAGSSRSSDQQSTNDQIANTLRQALGQMLSSANPPAPAGSGALSGSGAPTGTVQNYESQLQQLSDMGINDRMVALQALQAAGGDIHLALEIIYGSTDM